MAQDADDVLNKDCNPVSAEEKDLFQEKKKFICSVFERAKHWFDNRSQHVTPKVSANILVHTTKRMQK